MFFFSLQRASRYKKLSGVNWKHLHAKSGQFSEMIWDISYLSFSAVCWSKHGFASTCSFSESVFPLLVRHKIEFFHFVTRYIRSFALQVFQWLCFFLFSDRHVGKLKSISHSVSIVVKSIGHKMGGSKRKSERTSACLLAGLLGQERRKAATRHNTYTNRLDNWKKLLGRQIDFIIPTKRRDNRRT